MAKKKVSRKKKTKVKLQLSEDQKRLLTKAFGAAVSKRLSSIDIEQIAGYIRAEMHAN